MRKYKLIKDYPGSPELNSIIIVEKNKTVTIDMNNIGTLIHMNPFNYPEYWKEIIEKDYEILSFTHKHNTVPSNQYKNGFVKWNMANNAQWISIEKILLENNHNIHSVKRLSDGEIFTIGDKINGYDLNKFTDLSAFYIKNNKLMIGHRHLGLIDIKNTKKYIEPLFTTEDGVDIFEDNQSLIYYIPINEFKYHSIMACNYWTNEFHYNKEHKLINWSNLYFSTKEKAKEYILLNKPMFSSNDVLSLMDRFSMMTKLAQKDLIIRTAKLKFKL